MKPIVLLDPSPRTEAEIFSTAALAELETDFKVIRRNHVNPQSFYQQQLSNAQFVIGQPSLNREMIYSAECLRAIINVESNFLQNMDYEACFRNMIHVLTVSPVFAQPVAELALGLTLSLARDIPHAHQSFTEGKEEYGLSGNRSSRVLQGCKLGFVGFGDLGQAIHKVFSGLSPTVKAYDPWISSSQLKRMGVEPAGLDEVLVESDIVQVVATVTDESNQLLSEREFSLMQPGALLVLMSRAEVVDFDALISACQQGRIRAATDVFPEEPLPQDHPARSTPNLILSAHRAGALLSALFEIGDRTLADLQLMKRGLPPQNCKRAQHEIVNQVKSKPIEQS